MSELSSYITVMIGPCVWRLPLLPCATHHTSPKEPLPIRAMNSSARMTHAAGWSRWPMIASAIPDAAKMIATIKVPAKTPANSMHPSLVQSPSPLLLPIA